MAIVTPVKAGLIYNPIFVASDYFKTGNGDKSSDWTVDADLSYSNEAMAKMVPITITKTAEDVTDETTMTTGAKNEMEKSPRQPHLHGKIAPP